jgi:hypothetical protein
MIMKIPPFRPDRKAPRPIGTGQAVGTLIGMTWTLVFLVRRIWLLGRFICGFYAANKQNVE